MNKYSLIIPCYNEEKNLPKLFSKFSNSFENYKIEIIFVDNGSTDNTNYLLNEFSKKKKSVKIISVKKNVGYGHGILQGLNKSSGNFVGWTHADLQTNPEDFIKAVELIEKNKGENMFVKGVRHGRNYFDMIFTLGMTLFECILLRKWLSDINGQPTVFNKQLFLNWKNPPHDFSLDLYTFYNAKIKKYDIIRVPVFFGKRYSGVGSNDGLKAKIKYSFKTINYSFKIVFNNLRKRDVKNSSSYK